MAYTNKAKSKSEEIEQVKNEQPIKEEVELNSEDTITVSKSEFEQMKAQMQMMMQMMAMGNGSQKKEKKPERYITFVNMTKGKYVLKGSSYYTIDKQFDSRKFLEREALLIVNNMINPIKNGDIYIADADFVQECDLEGVYETLLTDKEMIDLLNHDASYVVDVYKSASNGQKKIIVDMIENKKLNGQQIDANILLQIGELCGKDFIHMESMEDMKEG